MGLIYLDTCLVIYLVEAHRDLGPKVSELVDDPESSFAISPLVRMECLVAPLKNNDEPLLSRYETVLGKFHNLPVSEDAFVAAARLRAEHGLRTPDALHLAVARTGGCDAFWTNDDRLAKAAPGFAHDLSVL